MYCLSFFIVIFDCTPRHYADGEQFTDALIINWKDQVFFARM